MVKNGLFPTEYIFLNKKNREKAYFSVKKSIKCKKLVKKSNKESREILFDFIDFPTMKCYNRLKSVR